MLTIFQCRSARRPGFGRRDRNSLAGLSLVWLVASILAGCPQGSGSPANTGTVKKPQAATSLASPPDSLPTSKHATPAPAITPRFVEIAGVAGIEFTFFSDAVPERYFLPEVMGGGAAWFDYDGDGRLDLYLPNGCELDHPDPRQQRHLHRLFRNLGGGRFSDVTAHCGAGHNGYGQGCAVGDFDADGFPDLYVTCYGPNVLYHNNGDGTFTDVTEKSGTLDPLWSTGVCWLDVDGDTYLDLYVANYLDVTLENTNICLFSGKPGYCGPGNYDAQPDRLFLSRGDGTFVESAQSLGLVGVKGNGLSVTVADFDDDLRPEIYVANDMAPNYLFTRSVPADSETTSDHPYSDLGFAAGCAVSGNGQNEASMGIACGDFDCDGTLDIFLTHYYHMKNTLYRNLGNLVFEDDSYRSKIAAASHETLGFGTAALDYDRDGALDLFIANGHVLGPHHEPDAMPPKLLRNDGRARFDDISRFAGPYFEQLWLGRGVAAADFDNDGDVDIAVTHIHRPFALLRNDTQSRRHFLGLALTTANRVPPVGGRVVITAGGLRQVRHLMAGGSYLSWHDDRLLVGLGDHTGPVHVEIHWPSGRIDTFDDLVIDQYWQIREGSAPRAARQFHDE